MIDSEIYDSQSMDESDREQTVDLNTGYDNRKNELELIVRHSENVVWPEYVISIKELSMGYVVVVVNENDIEKLDEVEGVYFVEKPARFYFR